MLVSGLEDAADEILKNLALAGINHICIVKSDRIVEEKHLKTSFLLRKQHVGLLYDEAISMSLRELNDNLKIELMEFPESFSGFNVFLLNGMQKLSDLITLNSECRRDSCIFFYCFSRGSLSFLFCDLLNENYCTIEDLWKFDASCIAKRRLPDYFAFLAFLKFMDDSYEISPLLQESINQISFEDTLVPSVLAVSGGICAQEIIKALTRDQNTLNNVFIFDSMAGYYLKINN